MSLMDRVAAGLESLGKRANQALDEGKLRMDLLRARRRMDAAARDLGYVTYRQAKGSPAPQGEIETHTRRIAESEAEAERLQAALDRLHAERRGAGPGTPPPAAGAPSDGPAATGAASPSPEGEGSAQP